MAQQTSRARYRSENNKYVIRSPLTYAVETRNWIVKNRLQTNECVDKNKVKGEKTQTQKY